MGVDSDSLAREHTFIGQMYSMLDVSFERNKSYWLDSNYLLPADMRGTVK